MQDQRTIIKPNLGAQHPQYVDVQPIPSGGNLHLLNPLEMLVCRENNKIGLPSCSASWNPPFSTAKSGTKGRQWSTLAHRLTVICLSPWQVGLKRPELPGVAHGPCHRGSAATKSAPCEGHQSNQAPPRLYDRAAPHTRPTV